MQNILYENNRRIAEHKEGAENCEKNCILQIKTFEKTTRQTIREWAFHLEALAELGAFGPISTICTYINRKLVDSFGTSQFESTVYRALDDRFKQPQFQKGGALAHDVYYQNKVDSFTIPPVSQIENMLTDPKDFAKSLAQVTIYDAIKNDSVIEQFDSLDARQARECISKLESIKRLCERKVIDAGLSLLDDESKKHPDPISTKFPEPRVTTFYEELLRGHKVIDALAQKVYRFPPSPQDEKKFCEAVRILWDLWSSGTDNKWRASTMRWFKIIKSRFEYGKHAAAVLNFTKTNICKDCGNEMDESQYETSKCLSCGSTNAETRALTREQVGDRQEHIVNLAFRTCRYVPWIAEIAMWQLKWKDRRNAQRSKDLRPKLSELA